MKNLLGSAIAVSLISGCGVWYAPEPITLAAATHQATVEQHRTDHPSRQAERDARTAKFLLQWQNNYRKQATIYRKRGDLPSDILECENEANSAVDVVGQIITKENCLQARNLRRYGS